MRRSQHNYKNLYQDFGIIILSVLIAVLLAQSGALERFVVAIGELRMMGSFIAGILFTSIFTAAPATVLLGEFAQANSAWTVAFIGALGAVTGDYIIFHFIRDRFSSDILTLLQQHRYQRMKNIFRLRSSQWMLGAIGLFIIASPLPDELGVTLLGFSKTKRRFFLLISFTANFLGILAIGLAAKNFS
ncbi:MAG: hypothetical protein Q8P73_03390 [bacterium]|nr:hypothetical protein [bacterium]